MNSFNPDFSKPSGNGQVPERLPSHAEQEERLLEYLDGQLGPDDSRAVEEHLGRCAMCRQLRQDWQKIDSQLARNPRPGLSPTFARDLRLRIEGLQSRDVQEQPRLAIEAELASKWNSLRQRYLRAQALWLIDAAGVGVVLAVAAYRLYASRLLERVPDLLAMSPQSSIVAASVSSALLIVSAGFALLARRRMTQIFARF